MVDVGALAIIERFSISKCLLRLRIEQCYVHAFRTYIFAKAYTLQRGLAAIADLLVYICDASELDGRLRHGAGTQPLPM